MPEGPFGGPRPLAQSNCLAVLIIGIDTTEHDIISDYLFGVEDVMGETNADILVERMEKHKKNLSDWVNEVNNESEIFKTISIPIEETELSFVVDYKRVADNVFGEDIRAVEIGSVEV